MKNRTCAVVPCVIAARLAVGVGLCATTMGFAAAALPTYSFASNSVASSSSELPPVRDTLSEDEAKALPGCESFIDVDKKEVVIRPKDGASEGVISYSLDNKKGDFTEIRKNLIFNDLGDHFPVRFDKRVYIYGSTEPSANDTLFYQMHAETINITPNLSIKFAKNLATFFMQNYKKSANRLHYIKGIENWDTSKIESMEKMFNLASQLEGKLDLSKWNVSNVGTFKLMFSGVGNENDNFVLDFSNKKFKNSADVTNMFNSFRGVLVANGWTVADPNGSNNPIQKLLDNSSNMLTHWNGSAYTGPSWHLLITDNSTILEKNKTEKYKFYKKVKVIYKVNGTEKSAELELPAVYDSRIDANGKPDASKPACSDPMKVVRPQIDEAIKNAVKELRTKNPDLNLPQNVIPVPVHDLKDAKSPIELFQDYYLGIVKEEVIKAKTTYTADSSLKYQEVVTDTKAVDGKKQVITGAMKNGAWDPDATSEKEITKVVNGKARVGNKKVENEDLNPATVYEADSSLAYNTTTETAGTKGTKTTTTTYKVNPDTGLTDEVDGTPKVETQAAKDKVIKVGNVEKKTSDIPFKKTYEGNPDLTYQKQETKTAGQNGKEEVTLTYKVDAKIGLTTDVEAKKGSCTKPVNEVVQVGNKEVTQNNDGSTTTKTYKVNPDDGTLSDPTVVTSRPWTDIASGAAVSEVLKAKMTYVADESLPYGQTQKVNDPKDGEKITTPTGKVVNGQWVEGEPKVEIKAAVNGVTKVGNKKVETEELNPATVYEADSSLDYKKEQTTEGTKGTKTTTTIYKVNPDTGLTAEVEGTPTVETVKAKDKVIKVGNVEKKTSDIPCKKTYKGNPDLTYKAQQTKTAGKNGKEEVTLTYKVDAKTGLTSEVEAKKGSCTKPVNEVVQVGNKEVIQNNDGSTTTKTYKVNPNDGTLSDPTVVTTKPPVQNQKTVTFNKKDGSLLSTVKVETGKKVAAASMPAAPAEDGFTFKEWNTQQDGQGKAFTADTVVNEDMTVYAVYTKSTVTPPTPQPQPQPQPPVPNPNPSEEGGSGSAGAFGYQAENELTAMYRLYNPYSHEHLFTTDVIEKDNLVTLGWRFEGAVGKVYMHGEKGGVYRLYNPNTGEHHYTMKEDEVAKCVKAGWRNEGVKFFSVLDEDKQVNGMVSMYNPYEKKFYHHYTSDANEIAKMVKDGWRKEEIKWYAAK